MKQKTQRMSWGRQNWKPSYATTAQKQPKAFYSSKMTTAHRPTWAAAIGRTNQGGFDMGGEN